MIGFGIGGPAGIDTRRSRVPRTMLIQPFSLSANQTQRFDLTGTGIDTILLTTATGAVNGYFGEYSGGSGQSLPHFLGLAGECFPVPLTPGEEYIITIQEGAGSTATGTIVFLYHGG